MAILVDHQPINQPTGSRDYGPFTIPDGLTSAALRLARATDATPTFWPNASTQVSGQVFLSLDGGATFPYMIVGFSAIGGIFTNAQGIQVPESVATANGVPLASGRRLKATVVVVNGPLVSQITLEAN